MWYFSGLGALFSALTFEQGRLGLRDVLRVASTCDTRTYITTFLIYILVPCLNSIHFHP
jgi:hypothetical protein